MHFIGARLLPRFQTWSKSTVDWISGLRNSLVTTQYQVPSVSIWFLQIADRVYLKTQTFSFSVAFLCALVRTHSVMYINVTKCVQYSRTRATSVWWAYAGVRITNNVTLTDSWMPLRKLLSTLMQHNHFIDHTSYSRDIKRSQLRASNKCYACDIY